MKVLIVDDNENDLELIFRYLNEKMTNIKIAKCRSYLDLVTLDFTNYDIVICDYDLGMYQSNDVYNLMKEMDCDVPFIIISGSVREVMVAGHHFIDKNRLEDLPNLIKELYDISRLKKRVDSL